MYRLIAGLLDVYRYDSNTKQIIIASHDLARTVESVVQELLPLALAQDITLTAVLPREPRPVLCDVEERRIVIENLLDNGLKNTKPRGTVTRTSHINPKSSPKAV